MDPKSKRHIEFEFEVGMGSFRTLLNPNFEKMVTTCVEIFSPVSPDADMLNMKLPKFKYSVEYTTIPT